MAAARSRYHLSWMPLIVGRIELAFKALETVGFLSISMDALTYPHTHTCGVLVRLSFLVFCLSSGMIYVLIDRLPPFPPFFFLSRFKHLIYPYYPYGLLLFSLCVLREED